MEQALNNLPLVDGQVLPVHQVPQEFLQQELNKLDATAAHRVANDEPAPGPFGSATALVNVASGEKFIIGDRHDSNRVNRDGPQAHAEAVSLYPDHFKVTTQALEKIKDDCNWVLVFLSTGQSFPSCFTKQHVAVDAWKQAGLIDEGRVLNFYGADYDMTKAVAGFSDKDQLDDMLNHPIGAPLNKGKVNFIGHNILDINFYAQDVFRNSDRPVAVIMRGGNIIATGYDTRKEDQDLLATAEMNAVKNACHKQNEQGIEKPWSLEGATMVSASPIYELPLARTAMFWANIGIGIHLRDTYMDASQFERLQTVEAIGMTNAQLYQAGTYQTQGRADTLIHAFQANLTGPDAFQNLAQNAWPKRVAQDEAKGKSIHYDGGGADSSPNHTCC